MSLARRTLLKTLGASVIAGVGGVVAGAPGRSLADSGAVPISRPIAKTGEMLPVVGLGSWITFNVGDDPVLLDGCAEVIAAFFAGGGRLIDSSPMYGSSQDTIGYALNKLKTPQALFSADKIWTSRAAEGPTQLAQTRSKWRAGKMDLMQVHNLLSWRAHLEMLRAKKDAGEIRYIGITTSHGSRHDAVAEIMSRHEIDFVQLTYNILDREPETRILPLARERGIAIIVNRPYRRGALIRRFAGQPLPGLANEIGARSWAQFLLKFIVSHPAVTCAIPATTQVAHVQENLAAAAGPLPDAGMRRRMVEAISRF